MNKPKIQKKKRKSAARGNITILNTVKNASSNKTIAQEIAKSMGRSAYISTAVTEIATDQIQDAIIDNTASSLISSNELINRSSAGDMALDSILGGDKAAQSLIDIAEKSGRNYHNLIDYLNKLEAIYKKCCEDKGRVKK